MTSPILPIHPAPERFAEGRHSASMGVSPGNPRGPASETALAVTPVRHCRAGIAVLAALGLLAGCSSDDETPATAQSGYGFKTDQPPIRSDRKERIIELLQREAMPTEAEIKAVGDDVDSILADIVNDRKGNPGIKVRAIACLAYFKNKRARNVLTCVVHDPEWAVGYKVEALKALALVAGEEAMPTLKEKARDPDPQIRLAAVTGIISVGGQQAVDLLQALQVNEQDPSVLQEIDRGLRTIKLLPFEEQ